MDIEKKEEYKKIFSEDIYLKDKSFSYRLDKILDIREFEIDLYWKRATYFWTFNAAALTGYGLTISYKTNQNITGILKFQFIIICLGIVFSLGWYLVNKGSKFWQENWEKHLDMLEDEVMGPLYKTTIHKKTYSNFWIPTKSYAASVSKINQILSLFVLLIWVGILIDLFVSKQITILYLKEAYFFYIFSGIATIAIMIYLILGTRTSDKDTKVHFKKREVVDLKK